LKTRAAAEEIVWLGDLPIATIQGGAAYTIAPDHLGAPHQIVNSSNTQVWFWNHDPFGNGAPSAAAGFAHRLRYPGQVYDAETGLHSNGHRDYDPRLGRYVESDPIGLAGGINTYVYAGNNPVNAIDPLGLDPKSNEDDAEALPTIDIAGQQNVVEAGVFDIFRLFKSGTKVQKHAGNIPVLRQQYIDAVGGLAGKVPGMRAAGRSPEEIARALHAERRALGEQFKNLTPESKRLEIYERNMQLYGDKLGPSIDWLRAQGKSWEQIIESATRTGGMDLRF
jgi:RHS repeat-associated protein